ncbi:hypothetical protein GCM10007855_36760 [Aliivibrio sifiae]|uniref:Uncharacterized protein n=1 Tax=Aliivibrio sifiae TaxID=566293 RepID=A0ABQ6APG5_9GAMM|nr:hypothetical protein GCM10007855_36760 [Aliivibrio sifiae]
MVKPKSKPTNINATIAIGTVKFIDYLAINTIRKNQNNNLVGQFKNNNLSHGFISITFKISNVIVIYS